MSDGPHKSLPMKSRWRSVAERAYNNTFGLDEIGAAMVPALASDCRDEIPAGFIDRLGSLLYRQESLLFKDDLRAQVESLRPLCGTGLGRQVLENVIHLSTGEQASIMVAIEAFERALVERVAKSSRQIEEHALRKSKAGASNVRARLEQATAKAPLRNLARQILKIDKARPPRSSTKRHGLDEGPKL